VASLRRHGIAALGAGFALVSLIWLGAKPSVVDAAHRTSPRPDQAADRDRELQTFLDGLQRLRANDESVLPALRACAERLCVEHDRCDVRDVLRYYAAQSPADRAHGLDEERRWTDLWDQVRRARSDEVTPEEWKLARDPILDELAAMIARNVDGPDWVSAARALSLRARLAIEQTDGDYELAPEEFDELLASVERDVVSALALFERAGQLKPRLEPLWIQCRIQAARREDRAARSSLQDCLALARHVANEDFQEHALAGMIRLAREAGDLKEIERLLRELSRFRRPSESWLLVKRQAELLLQRDYAGEAARFLDRFPPTDPTDRREWQVMLGSARLRSGDLAAAERAYLANVELPWPAHVKLVMASFHLRQGDARATVQLLEKLDDLPPDQRRRASELLGAARVRLREFDSAIEPLTRALDYATRVQVRLREQREVANVVGENVGVHTLALLARANAELGRGVEAARVIEAYQSLTLRNALQEGDGALERRDLESGDLLAWAEHFERGLVTWVVGPDSTVAVHVAADGRALALPIEAGRKSIEDAVRRLREAIIAGDDGARARLFGEIATRLFPDSLRDSIAKTPSGRLLFLAHGPLERLPVELFEIDGALVESPLVPVILPGLPDRRPGPALARAEFDGWSILGSPIDAAGVTRLPGASLELSEVAALHMDAELAIESAFTRDAVIAALRTTRAAHIATHLESGVGSRANRLADVGLELSGGDALSAEEIASIRPRLPLAVLLACETGGGDFIDSEGLHGVARAFLESGTRNLVVTSWPVADLAARAFANAFHESLNAGSSPSQATAAARIALRQAGFPAVEWAAFRAVGRE
jgi:tetratricopeptide (TPR) repeat protein